MKPLSNFSEIFNPPQWKKPKGYSNVIITPPNARLIFIAGQIGWNEQEEFPFGDMVGQTRLALNNIVTCLEGVGAKRENITRLTWYITQKEEYYAHIKEIGQVYREVIGKHYPTMAMVQVVALMEAKAKIEIEATAFIV